MIKYLIRLDDACPTMDATKWQQMEDILDRYGVRPMVGVIPCNKDPKQLIDLPDSHFWDKVNKWSLKGWSIAQHGYDHVCISDKGLDGINPFWARSEFAGVPLEIQKEKIRKGIAILRSKNINPAFFFAPSHTFDKNTLVALQEESDIRIISDTIACRPYKKDNFVFIPQLGGHCMEMKLSGFWTFCFHPTTMEKKQFETLESFLAIHASDFISFDDLDLHNLGSKDLMGRILSWGYFLSRKLRKIR